MNIVDCSLNALRVVAYAAVGLACASPAGAQTTTPLWSFGAGADGALPVGTFVGRPGRLFGVTLGGGASGFGTVYTVGQSGQEKVLHSFTNGADGGIPAAGLVKVGDTLYGTNETGGTTGNGVVFAVNATTGAETTVYSFGGGSDGGSPLAGVTYLDGVLYGTAFLGGKYGDGTAFKIDLKTGKETTLHSFGASGDGNSPESNLISKDGLLYGTTEIGGKYNAGTVYSLNPASGAETILYSLDGSAGGSAPQSGLVLKGNDLYGTASTGGAADAGTIFRVNLKTGKAKTVYVFSGGDDGKDPLTGLTAQGGTLYGTANFGGSNGDGTLFALSVPGYTLTVLHAFTGAKDGKYPQASLYYAKGAFYGVANAGGTTGYGTAFSLTVP